jgi:hypothetical protein
MTLYAETDGLSGTNFFISYTQSDLEAASWIAWELERAGFTYRMQGEDFPPGSRFLAEMRRWLQAAEHLIAVLSPAYFESRFASLEINAVVAEDPLGLKRRAIPVKVLECEIPTIFSDLVYIDLSDKREPEEARRALLAGVRAARLGSHSADRSVKKRPGWPPSRMIDVATPSAKTGAVGTSSEYPIRIQFFACDVGRGLDLKGQYERLQTVLGVSRFAKQLELRAEFDVTDANLFTKLNSYRPHVVHISGNQNGGDVLFPSVTGGEVVVPDDALAGLLSSLGPGVRLVIIDTCQSYACAKRVSEVIPCALGVKDDIYDSEATRFYEVFYQAAGAGHSIRDAVGQAVAALKFLRVPKGRIPQLCVGASADASQLFLTPR